MSQMPQSAAGSSCPNPACEEPVESGDRFCGGCGLDLSALWAAADRPTLAVGGVPAERGSAAGGSGATRGAAAQGSAGSAHPGPARPAPYPAVPSPSVDGYAGRAEHGADGEPAPGVDGFWAAAPAASGHSTGPDGASAASVEWPAAPGTEGSEPPAPVHLPSDLPGTDSQGDQLPMGNGLAAHPAVPGQSPVPSPPPAAAAWPASPPAPAAEPDDYELAAPQPPAGSAGMVRDDPPAVGAAGVPADPRTVEDDTLSTPLPDVRLCVFCAAGRIDRDDYCENCGKAQPRERDHIEQELATVAAVSDRGLRHHRNEDAFAVSSTVLQDGAPAVLAVVCDGVSSATRPDDASITASRTATQSLLAALPRGTHPQQAMHEAIIAAADAVNALAEEPATLREQGPNQNAPACTLVGAIVAKDLLIVGWVGDSRAYWVPVDRSAPPARLTEDDSWAAQMVATGLMNEAEAYADERAHAITGWLGADAYELEPHTAAFKPDRPGVVVVCTDGLWNYAEAAGDMASVLPPDAAQRPLAAAQVLVGHALDGGGHDNVTVAVLPFPAPAPGAGSA
ncbi:protein phosphatase 2C domain-containing protein [Streptomyces sp. TS71-3]|uniref:protein phosphatase 2C domain-containing protein n=1 Tax=Streptomyces sp. TS71-3 TaxID=2733862 RepID=UPI001B14F96C|nr:protein phosphatase 2C domain-containing protein [Streptomyces sp. TS71-3]GHJ37560.1 hypothetical protein Sm713_31690 [Streptomyces sp. TS71-3]